MQIEKLKKLLELTTSTNDHEALVAIRKANEILKNSDTTWSQVFEASSTEANTKYEQLLLKFNEQQLAYNMLANKYNQLVQMVATRQAAHQFAGAVPQRRAPRKRPFRF